MRIKNNVTIVLTILLLLISLSYVETVSSSGLGVAPAQIVMENRLKGTSYFKSIRLINRVHQKAVYPRRGLLILRVPHLESTYGHQ